MSEQKSIGEWMEDALCRRSRSADGHLFRGVDV